MRFAPLLALLVALEAGAARNSSGTYSLPSGNPVTSGSTISSTWANNTLSDISTEITNSLDRSGRGAMLAPIQLSTGSCAAPSMTFGVDTDVGLWRSTTNEVAMCVATNSTMRWTTTGPVFSMLATADKGIVANQSTANSAAVVATGKGTGAGVAGYGEGTTTPPVSITTRVGVIGVGGSTGGYGGLFYGNATNSGVAALGGATSGRGVEGYGGAPNGVGVYAEGTGTGAALQVGPGHATFTGSNPASTTGFTNTQTPANLVKAWGYLTTTGSGAVTVTRGFNVTSAAATGPASFYVTVTLATGLDSSTYGVSCTEMRGNPYACSALIVDATHVKLFLWDITSLGGSVDVTGAGQKLSFVIFGIQ